MKELLNRFLGYWNSLDRTKKIIFPLIGAVIIILMIVIISIVAAPKYSLLLSGLSEEQAGSVISKLTELKVSYQAGPNGSIYISGSDVYDIRMKLAASGIIGNKSRGYEILKEQGFGATSYDKQVNFQIALEGELSRSISSIKDVSFARVHLVIPPRTYYNVGENSIPKASVLIAMKGATSPSVDQIKGIIEFVSGSVEGLDPKNVKVVDSYSRDLSSQVMTDFDVGSANNKFQMKKEIESYYSKKIQETLQTVFGFGNVAVISEVTLNWQKIEEQQRKLTPVDKSTGIILSQQQESEESKSDSGGNATVGVDANTPPFSYQTPESSGSQNYKRSKTITNYDTNELFTKTMEDKNGEISDKSFTVFVDFTKYGTVTEQVKNDIQSSIANAAGAKLTNISLVPMAFNRELDTIRSKVEGEQEKRQRITIIIIFIIITIMILASISYLILRYSRRKKTYALLEERKKKLDERVRDFIGEVKEEVPEELTPSQENQKKLEDIVDSRMDDVIEIVRIWINGR